MDNLTTGYEEFVDNFDVSRESSIYDVARDHSDWVCMAALDQSESYEVDLVEIWRDGNGRFQLVTASGCSCWGGEYDVEGDGFDSIPAIAAFLATQDTTSGYNPSVTGRDRLIAQAQAVGGPPIARPEGVSDGDIAAVERLLGKNPPGWN